MTFKQKVKTQKLGHIPTSLRGDFTDYLCLYLPSIAACICLYLPSIAACICLYLPSISNCIQKHESFEIAPISPRQA
jgi:hypothetical protein